MIEVRLSNASLQKPILAFDGRVLEVFWVTSNEGSERYHAGHIQSIQLALNNKGRHILEWKTEFHGFKEEVSEEALPKAEQLVAEVQKAMKLSI